jgi:hypothetical protein
MRHAPWIAVVLASAVLAGGAAFAAAGRVAGQGNAVTKVGPGEATAIFAVDRYRLELRLSPNEQTVAGTISLRLTRRGKPVSGAAVKATLTMLDMQMGSQSATLPQTGTGRYARTTPLLAMRGRWGLRLRVAPLRGAAFSVGLVDTVA